MKLTCYIVDDEPLAIEVLESHIEKYDRLEIAGTFQNAVKAFQTIQEEPVDLLFLDIRMPGLSGTELLRTLKNPPKVIFTTAYREYAIEGFELDVVDYLLKPVSFERFLRAMGKVVELEKTGRSVPPANTLEKQDSYLFVQAGNRKVRISPVEILYIESKKSGVEIVCRSEKIQTYLQISDLEDKLRPAGFVRIHRSYMVPLDKIQSWSSTEVEVPGSTLPVGRTYKKVVLKILEQRSEML